MSRKNIEKLTAYTLVLGGILITNGAAVAQESEIELASETTHSDDAVVDADAPSDADLLLTPIYGFEVDPDYEQEYSADVIVQAILAWTEDHECGWYCTEDRRDDVPDRSDYIVSIEDAYALADAMLEVNQEFPRVTIPILVGLGWHETNMQRFAVGPGGECGVFQQTPRYTRPEEIREALNDDYDAICDWLQVPENAVLAFAHNANRWIRRAGNDEWLCHYNQGHAGCNPEGIEYQGDVGRTIRRVERNLDRLADREEDGEELSFRHLIGRTPAISEASEAVHGAINNYLELAEGDSEEIIVTTEGDEVAFDM